jgi:fatty-acyl-CoA synthase
LACVSLADGRRYSYAELDAEVGRWAAHLAEVLAPGARVALLARNSVVHLVLFYACARAGAVFVPLNWRLPAKELAALLADCAPERLFVDDEFRGAGEEAARLAGIGADRVIASTASPAPAKATPVLAPADAPATLLYTSGTTGRPKGVIITRRSAFFGAYNFMQVGSLTTESVLLADAPLFHVVGLLAVMHAGLGAGGTVLVSDRFVPAVTLQRLSDPALGVTHYFCVPQMAQAMKDEPGFAETDLSHLKGLFTGGAPMPPSLTLAYLDRRVPMSNGFGMSEAGTVMHVPPDLEVARAKLGAAGVPAPAVEVRLVRQDGYDAETGEVGEVWLRGPGVSPGYWNQPDATAAAFADGWFRTGDAARQDEDGVYFLVDRWKDMYITGGENVYPAEVEAALHELEGVRDVAVVGVPDARWGESGCAFVVRAPGSALDAAAVIAFCGRHLAGYKRPSAVRFVDTLPRTASGKIQKDALRRAFAAEIPPNAPIEGTAP